MKRDNKESLNAVLSYTKDSSHSLPFDFAEDKPGRGKILRPNFIGARNDKEILLNDLILRV